LRSAAFNIRAASYQTHLAVINTTVSVGYTDEYLKPLSDSAPATRFRSITAGVSYEIHLWGQLAAEKDAAR
jgi:outer membrane protein TolC